MDWCIETKYVNLTLWARVHTCQTNNKYYRLQIGLISIDTMNTIYSS
jgi:hypothetical protein